MALRAVKVMAVITLLLVAVLIVSFEVVQHKAANSGPEQPQSSNLPSAVGGLSVACDGVGQAFPAAPAFDGPSPHPIAVFDDSGKQVTDLGQAASAPWAPDSPTTVQLLGCVSATGGLPDSNQSCLYGEDINSEFDISIIQESYEIDVYDLRTHHKIAGTTVHGADETCPSTAFLHEMIYATLTTAQYHALLDQYVMGKP
jgi:hypothetical protein